MKLRITALILTMVMLLMMLSGCGAAEAKPESTTMAATEAPEMMVPKVAYLNFLEEGDNPAWQFVWKFHWNEEGYLTQIEGEKRINGDTAYLSQYYVEKEDGWYGSYDFYPYPVQVYDDSHFYGPFNMEPGEYRQSSWVTGNRTVGRTHTYMCTKITAGTRDYQNPKRINNNIPEDYTYEKWQSPKWLYADFTYDEYGNAIRIDTYNLKEELCGYTEVEWVPLKSMMEIEKEPAKDAIYLRVPKVANLHFLKENGGPEWQYIWNFKWNEQGYLTAVYGDKIVNSNIWDAAQYFVKENDGWYNTGGILMHGSFEDLYPQYKYGPEIHLPGEYSGEGYGESNYTVGLNRTIICAKITGETRDYLTPDRIYNNLPEDYTYDEFQTREWLYADFIYDEYGNPIRIDTYNLEGELSGYTEIEWMEIEIKP